MRGVGSAALNEYTQLQLRKPDKSIVAEQNKKYQSISRAHPIEFDRTRYVYILAINTLLILSNDIFFIH